MYYEPYYKYRKPKNRAVAQRSVAQTKTKVIRARVSEELHSKVIAIGNEKGLTPSEMTRKLWEDYIDKLEKAAWNEEIQEMFS